jgi:glycosyltransferase involved in cell wall biosynthesis
MTQNFITDHLHYRAKFDQLAVCVLIPTYNNASTLAGVISDVLAYTSNIIVVNDGSTDGSENIPTKFSTVEYLGYEKNVGKGWALRKGLQYAIGMGYRYAITIDSDGQHFAKDLPNFIDKLEYAHDAIIIGARNMDQASVPGKSSFGNKFSNFWFRVETGVSMPDTQSGYRLYPLEPLKNIRFFTRKYEFEIEVLVRAAWKGVKVESVPVSVYYAPKETRVSHFRPFKDFTRISILNTALVFITFLYIRPRNFLQALRKKKIKELIREQLFNPAQSDWLKAASIAFGVFMGIIPVWGFQLVIAIFLAILLKLNKALVILAAHVSVPPMIPFIIYFSYHMGAIITGKKMVHLEFSQAISLDSIRANFEQYLYGSVFLASAAGLLCGFIAFVLLKLTKKRTTAAA